MGEATRDWTGMLERELYWRADAATELHGATEDLRIRLDRMAETLRADVDRGVPASEPSLREGRGWRRSLKRLLYRLFRPVTRRNDRVAADLAAMTADLVNRLTQTQAVVQRLDADLDALRRRADREPAPARERSARWSFEPSSEERTRRLGALEGLAASVRPEGEALWLDLGCGRGELLALLGRWGWRARGVEDDHPSVREAADRGLEAIEGDPVAYLAGYEDEPPAVVSAIGLLEHLPVERWDELFHGAQRILGAGGALVVETLDPGSSMGLSRFFSDPSVTRPVTREGVRRLAQRAGFERVDERDHADEGSFVMVATV